MADNLKFIIICSGYNGAKYINQCFNSIVNQTYKNFTAIMIDDGSVDNSHDVLNRLHGVDDRINVFTFSENKGAAYRRYQAINRLIKSNDEAVICLLGMDDHLNANALEAVKTLYDNGAWMTYGNWIGSDGYKLPIGFLDYPDEVHAKRCYRTETYRSTALNTFKKFLFDQLTEEDFKINGEWIKATTESNLMFSCLEMCGKERIGIVYDHIYNYTRRKDNTRNRNGSKYQDAIYANTVSRSKRNLLIR